MISSTPARPRGWSAICSPARISQPCTPNRWGDRWSILILPKCRRTPGYSFRGILRSRSSRRSATARRDPSCLSPQAAGLSREKSHIVEPQLIGREFGLWFARIDGWRGVDFRDGFSHEQALANEFGEAQVQHFQGIQAPREAQQQIGDHRSDDLQANGVVVLAHEFAKVEMLLDPAEQEFDLPATLVEGSNLNGCAVEIVGDESDRPAVVTFHLDASQRDRQFGIALAGEHDIGVVDDFKTVADGLAHVPRLRLAQARVDLDARDEESVGGVDLLPPAKVIIALVKNVGRAGFELRLTTDLDVIDGCRRNLDATRNIPPWMIDDVHLQAADTTVPFCPFAHLAQRDWARVDQPNHLGAFCSRVSIGLLRQHGEGFRENAHWTTCIRTRERRARNVAHPQMVMLMGVCLKGRFDSAQARDPAQLSAHHRHKMIPAFERFVVGIAVMPLDDFPKLPSIDRFEKLPKDAIHVLHARSFSVSRQPESIRFTLDLPGMRCGIVNHSRDSPALAGEGEEGSTMPCRPPNRPRVFRRTRPGLLRLPRSGA